ncbi:extracellular solute-binding protein [Nonomuraea glycinis]|uniref:Sugar ABC transporter substrate-binding protein n=1 Tax=Nonomuraea glycinis TaxID=2047744 RepID=A0A918A005_9ACTN|nr:extracellular solute-binding protein [Nonomuraea glycinis]MCA2174573.1 extracellular solute-binding protein [Nonomuraea glycinis]GGP02111.1 sugar ABC transporter substrate-binding protein [Nonomuraea glycinis]
MHMTTPPRRHALVALGVTAALALTACAGTGGTSAPAPVKQADVSTTIPSDPVTLTLAYSNDPPTQLLIDGFKKKHPNVTVKPQMTPFNDYIKSIKLAMSGDAAPDIAQYNPGAMNTLVPAGLILDLNPWAKAYGWTGKFPPSTLEILSSDKTAKQFGTGGLYAVPGGLSVVGVYYNKTMVKEAPKSLPEFEAALQKVKDSGGNPLSLGALQVGGFHLWNALLNVTGDVADYRGWVYGKPGSTIETDAARKATETLTNWAKKGYFPEGASATADPDALANFAKGRSAFLVTGNWGATALEKDLGKDVGFFLMPTPSGEPAKVASGASVAYAISAKSKHPNVAAAFLDYLSSPEAAKIEFDGGFMPVDTKAEVGGEGLRGEIATVFGPVAQANGIVPFPDYASPGMIDKLTPGIQALIGGKMTTDAFLKSLQESWDGHHGK